MISMRDDESIHALINVYPSYPLHCDSINWRNVLALDMPTRIFEYIYRRVESVTFPTIWKEHANYKHRDVSFADTYDCNILSSIYRDDTDSLYLNESNVRVYCQSHTYDGIPTLSYTQYAKLVLFTGATRLYNKYISNSQCRYSMYAQGPILEIMLADEKLLKGIVSEAILGYDKSPTYCSSVIRTVIERSAYSEWTIGYSIIKRQYSIVSEYINEDNYIQCLAYACAEPGYIHFVDRNNNHLYEILGMKNLHPE